MPTHVCFDVNINVSTNEGGVTWHWFTLDWSNLSDKKEISFIIRSTTNEVIEEHVEEETQNIFSAVDNYNDLMRKMRSYCGMISHDKNQSKTFINHVAPQNNNALYLPKIGRTKGRPKTSKRATSSTEKIEKENNIIKN